MGSCCCGAGRVGKMKVGSNYTLTYLQSTLLESKPNKLRKVVSEQQHELIIHVYTMNGIPTNTPCSHSHPYYYYYYYLLLLFATTNTFRFHMQCNDFSNTITHTHRHL